MYYAVEMQACSLGCHFVWLLRSDLAIVQGFASNKKECRALVRTWMAVYAITDPRERHRLFRSARLGMRRCQRELAIYKRHQATRS